MSDIVDIANDYVERELNALICSRVQYSGKSNSECADCGVEIPAERRMAVPGVRMCVECAGLAERSGAK